MDRIRQAVFSSLGRLVEGAHFIDLFSGSGSYGLEALSRGAVTGVFVERNRKALECMRSNLTAVLKSAGRDSVGFDVSVSDALNWRPADGKRAAIVFADPPYRLIESNLDRLFASFDAMLDRDPEARVVFEMPAELEVVQNGWTTLKRLGGGSIGSAVACIIARS